VSAAAILGFSQPDASHCSASLLSFHQRCCFAIERGVVRFARLQIKFVDHDLHQRRSRDGDKNAQQPKHGGGQRKKQEQ
jgi:hypothetical protein